MARKRFQRGYVYLDGNKWKGRYREDVITCTTEEVAHSLIGQPMA